MREDWAISMGDVLAKSRSLTTFSLTVNNHAEDIGIWASSVGDGLATGSPSSCLEKKPTIN